MATEPQSPTLSESAAAPPPAQVHELYRLMSGYRVSQALYVMATLGLADLLAAGPRDSDALAQATGTHAGALSRVLRFLVGVGVGVVREVAPRRFALTTLGAGLRADGPGSIRPSVLMLLDEAHGAAWGQLASSVRTGETAFAQVHGVEFFDYLSPYPATAAIFHHAMTSNTARSAAALARAYHFAAVQRLVDVGGGHGLLLASLLQAYPTMQGVLFDRPEMVAQARPTLETAGGAARCEVVGGDFVTAVPRGGDAYVPRQVTHDWDDARAALILAACQRALGEHGRLLVVERGIRLDGRDALPVLHLDLEMLVNLGGLQRTEAAYAQLFATAGLRLSAVVPVGDAENFSVFEGRVVTAAPAR